MVMLLSQQKDKNYPVKSPFYNANFINFELNLNVVSQNCKTISLLQGYIGWIIGFKWCTSGSEVIKLALFSWSFFGQDSLSLAMMHFLGRRGIDPQSLWPIDDQMELEHLFIYLSNLYCRPSYQRRFQAVHNEQAK